MLMFNRSQVYWGLALAGLAEIIIRAVAPYRGPTAEPAELGRETPADLCDLRVRRGYTSGTACHRARPTKNGPSRSR
jgi:hypothetical protein